METNNKHIEIRKKLRDKGISDPRLLPVKQDFTAINLQTQSQMISDHFQQ
jgi:hypothetical protein